MAIRTVTSYPQVPYRQKGFTLVEIVIVFIVIGLLITGVLKGKEFLENARVTKTIQDVRDIRVAAMAFAQRYGYPPGDYPTPANLQNCTAAPCTAAGNGDGLVWDYPRTTNGYGPHEATMPDSENMAFWAHLAGAEIYIATDPNNGITGATWPDPDDLGDSIGVTNPAAHLGGAFHIGYTPGALVFEVTDQPAGPGHYLALKFNPAKSTGGSATEGPILTAEIAARLDRKMDDGHPGRGEVRAAAGGPGAPGTCAASGAYLETDTELVQCALYFTIDLEAETDF